MVVKSEAPHAASLASEGVHLCLGAAELSGIIAFQSKSLSPRPFARSVCALCRSRRAFCSLRLAVSLRDLVGKGSLA